MGIRATIYDVQAVLETDSDIDLYPYIKVASVLTDKVEECATDRSAALNDEQLHDIETYLAAHLYALRDPQYSSKSTQSASASFQGQTAMKLDYTPFGQMAQVLDTSGCLSAYNVGARARAVWLGKPPSEQTDYEDRD